MFTEPFAQFHLPQDCQEESSRTLTSSFGARDFFPTVEDLVVRRSVVAERGYVTYQEARNSVKHPCLSCQTTSGHNFEHLDEAHFWLNGYVNKQNCRIWSEANPQVHVETPLHPEKLTVWCALWAGGILLQKR
ncbi:hypothetical protein TNCV_3493131 [Trichonephila clavipes]|nr:hypothetical protein TNCV_3493131 [Trichonephila clavipes]